MHPLSQYANRRSAFVMKGIAAFTFLLIRLRQSSANGGICDCTCSSATIGTKARSPGPGEFLHGRDLITPEEFELIENDIAEDPPFAFDDCKTPNMPAVADRSGTIDPRRRWPRDATSKSLYVPLFIGEDFDYWERRHVHAALYEIENQTCVIFNTSSDRNNYIGKDWVEITRIDGGGCFSETQINLDPRGMTPESCARKGICLHELMHALGFAHEHQRPDRDNYVDIVRANFNANATETDFGLLEHTTTFDIPYDYLSIMHYSLTAYSKNGQQTIKLKDASLDPTMVAKIGTVRNISTSDVRKISNMYPCR